MAKEERREDDKKEKKNHNHVKKLGKGKDVCIQQLFGAEKSQVAP